MCVRGGGDIYIKSVYSSFSDGVGLLNIPDITQKEGSDGPRPTSPWSHCEDGLYIYCILCEHVMILKVSFCAHCILPMLVLVAFVIQTGSCLG